MPRPTHLENCKRVCAVCWQKARRRACKAEFANINKFIISNYTPYSPYFPSGLCATCSRTLYRYRSGEFTRAITISTDFSPGHLRITGTDRDCSCRICEIASANPVPQRDRPFPYKNARVFFYEKKMFEVCPKCFAIVYQGNILIRIALLIALGYVQIGNRF